jgi:lipopolysaccharide export system protein LptA
VSITVERKTDSGETRIIEIRRVGTDETGIAATCAPRDEDPEGTPTITVYSETTERGVEVKVDKNVIRAPLAVVTKKEGGDGRVEVSAGTARYLDAAPEGKTDRFSLCEVEVLPQVTPGSVDVTQGKTRLKGSNLVYDESDGIARISGPINFNREDLTGTSERIEVDVDEETTTLVGNVEFRDGERTSRAARVDYDDTRNIAIMRGTPERPAESVTPRDSLKAQTIRYNLDTGEVVALGPGGGITGTFEDGEPSGATPGTPAPATPATPGTPSTPSTP